MSLSRRHQPKFMKSATNACSRLQQQTKTKTNAPKIFGATFKETYMEPTIIDEFRQGLTQIRTGVESTQNEITDLNTALKEVQRDHEETRKQLEKVRKAQLAGIGKPVLRAGQVVSDACARHLAAIFVLSA